MKKIKLLFYLIIFLLIIISVVINKGDYPRPTEAFYVNDFASKLMEGTKSSIMREGEKLYYMTEDEENGGSQVVFATFEVETMDDIANFDKTDLYRQWKIGKDDMGVLVLFFFLKDDPDDSGFPVETQIEVGYRMEQFLTPGLLGRMVDDAYLDQDINWLFDLSCVNILYQILEVLYVDVYGYDSFNYDMDAYYDYLLDYNAEDYGGYISDEPMSLMTYLVSPFVGFGTTAFSFLPYVIILLFSSGMILSKGGGGSSGGMGIFRRR